MEYLDIICNALFYIPRLLRDFVINNKEFISTLGPWAIACAAVYTIRNNNKENDKNRNQIQEENRNDRTHDRALKRHEDLLNKFEETHQLIYETGDWLLNFLNYRPGQIERSVNLPHPDTLQKAELIIILHIRELEGVVRNLNQSCETLKNIYVGIFRMIQSHSNKEKYKFLIDEFQSINNVPVLDLLKKLKLRT